MDQMAETMAAPGGSKGDVPAEAAPGTTKRDFLILATGAFAAVGAAGIAWPFLFSVAPSRDVLALASTEVDVSNIAVGQSVTVMWRGKPVFVRNRTPEEISEARAVPLAELKDPATDESRVKRPTGWSSWGCAPI
jgi:ubiquinol-cytochrome c reductase iron-sulfur subunit